MITLRRLGFATALALTATAAPSIPAGAATTPVSGMFVLDTGSVCTDPPAGFDELTFVISGDLEGCWYTNVDRARDLGPPSGLYFEAGREVFVGTVPRWPRRDLLVDLHVRIPMGPRLYKRRHGDLGTVPAPDRPRQRHRRIEGVTGHLVRTDVVTDVINDGSIGRYRGFLRQL